MNYNTVSYQQLFSKKGKQLIMRLCDYAFETEINEDRNATPNSLVDSHMRLVFSKARKYKQSYLYDDIVSAGLEQLVICANKFDVSSGISFAGYVGHQIDYAMMKEYQKFKYSFNPSNLSKDLRKAFYAYPKYFSEDEYDPTARETMAKDLEIPLTTVDEAVTIVQHRYEQLEDNQEFVSVSDTPDEHFARVQYEQIMDELISTAVNSLNEREQLIIKSRKLSDDPVELRLLGEELGVSHQRVAQIESGAVKKMLLSIDQKIKKENYVDLFE